jgi:hypothetical protein
MAFRRRAIGVGGLSSGPMHSPLAPDQSYPFGSFTSLRWCDMIINPHLYFTRHPFWPTAAPLFGTRVMPPCAHPGSRELGERSPATLRPWGRKALAPFGAEGATLPLLTSVDPTVDGRYSAAVVPTAAQSSSNEIVRTLKSSVAGLALLDWLRLTRQFSEGLTTKFSVIRCVSGTLKNRGVILSCSVLFLFSSPLHLR